MIRPGDAAEEQALRVIREYFPDARRARGSGSVHGDGDIVGTGVHIDIKDQTRGEGFTVRHTEWDKIKQQALHWDKYPVMVVRNKRGELKAICDLDFLMLILTHMPKEDL